MKFNKSLSQTLWTPERISTALWLDAADSSTITTVSGAVSEWNDKSGTGKTLVQTNASNRPTVQSAAVNGLNVIRFVGANAQHLLNTTAIFPLSNRGCFLVFRETTAVANAGLFAIRPATNQNDYESTLSVVYTPSNRLSNGVRFIVTGSTSSNYDVRDTTSPTVAIPLTIYGETFDSVSGTLWRNGTSIFTDNSFTAFSANSAGGYCVGARWVPNIAPPYLNGDVCEIIYMSTTPSTETRQRIEGYLAHKWGLTANLPSNHPFKNSPPRGL